MERSADWDEYLAGEEDRSDLSRQFPEEPSLQEHRCDSLLFDLDSVLVNGPWPAVKPLRTSTGLDTCSPET